MSTISYRDIIRRIGIFGRSPRRISSHLREFGLFLLFANVLPCRLQSYQVQILRQKDFRSRPQRRRRAEELGASPLQRRDPGPTSRLVPAR